jgi:dimethylargininase
MSGPFRALVRPPGRRYPDALTALVPPPPIDLALALAQHACYVGALRASGVDVIELAADDDHPDSVFVQDPVLVVDGCAIALRSAATSRQGEADALIAVLERCLQVARLRPPATLDGGDVLVTGDCLYVGLSARSNAEGCRQLAAITGRRVEGVTVPGGLLHLLSGCTYLGDDRLLVVQPLASRFPQFEVVLVPPGEASAANVLIVGRHAIVPSGYPRVAVLVEGSGFEVHAVPSSEFEKRDGGVTCRALLF